MAVSTSLLNKVRDAVSDSRVHLSEYEFRQDQTYNPIKAYVTITIDTGSVFGDVRINNISVEQPDQKEPNDLVVHLPSKFNKVKGKSYDNLQFGDRRVAEALCEVIRELYEDEMDRSGK